jgi:hypothetical protein
MLPNTPGPADRGLRRERRLGLLVVLCATFHAAAATVAPDDAGPRSDHALGFYDPQLRRVVLVCGGADPKIGDRDAVWSWSGKRWDLVTRAGPAGRVNAGAAYEAGRGRAVVAGGSRKTVDSATWEVVGDSWAGDARG